MTSDLSDELGGIWSDELCAVRELIAERFSRRETRAQAIAYIEGQLAGMDSPNGWTLAVRAGDRRPDRMQRLLYAARWDDAAVRADLRDYVVARFGGPGATLALGETAVVKQGSMTVGVDRQRVRATGRMENCQVSLHLAYASSRGRALIDGELYLNEGPWTQDAARRAVAGIPKERRHAARPELASSMLARALDAGVPAAWVVGDEEYGGSVALRRFVEARGLGYAFAIRPDQMLACGGRPVRVDEAAAAISPRAFELRAAEPGPRRAREPAAPRYAAWARLRLDSGSARGWSRFLLVRRIAERGGAGVPLPRRSGPWQRRGSDRYFVCCAPADTTLAELIRVTETAAGAEECLAALRAETGFDRHQVRLWRAWYRHATLCMLAAACLAVCRAIGPHSAA